MKNLWIGEMTMSYPVYKCSQCSMTYKYATPFCPHCGSEMENYDREKFNKSITHRRDDYETKIKVIVADKEVCYGGCANCKHHEDPEAVCIARQCIHAINELTDSYEPKEK